MRFRLLIMIKNISWISFNIQKIVHLKRLIILIIVLFTYLLYNRASSLLILLKLKWRIKIKHIDWWKHIFVIIILQSRPISSIVEDSLMLRLSHIFKLSILLELLYLRQSKISLVKMVSYVFILLGVEISQCFFFLWYAIIIF